MGKKPVPADLDPDAIVTASSGQRGSAYAHFTCTQGKELYVRRHRAKLSTRALTCVALELHLPHAG